MEIDNMTTIIGAVGLPCFLILVLVVGVWKAAPEVLQAYKDANAKRLETYKEGNDNVVSAIREVCVCLTSRLDKLENKVDELDDKVDDILNEKGA